MQATKKLSPELREGIAALATTKEAVRETSDHFGNIFHWFRLDAPRHIVRAAELLKAAGARLAMITAYERRRLEDPVQEVCYHFELGGLIVNVTVVLDAEWPLVPSITPVFKNADWHEREMMELYAVQVNAHPNPKRLFLDPSIDEGILGQAVPLSVVMNGASTRDLWERILSNRIKGGESAPAGNEAKS